MKSWLTKIKISSALDSGKSPSPGLERNLADSEELRRYANRLTHLHHALKRPPAESEFPPSLHAGIMRAVRADAAMQHSRHRPTLWWWWLAAASTVVLIVVGTRAVEERRKPPPAQVTAFAPAIAVLEACDQMVRVMPLEAVGPLAVELDRFHQDLTNAGQLILASLP